MDPLIILFIALPVAGLITWRLLIGSHHEGRHERTARNSLEHDTQRSRSVASLGRGNFQAMSIRICTSPCKAALAQRGQTFLMADAPPLPLPGCDRACHCEYQHHADRRINADRRYPAEDLVNVPKVPGLAQDHYGEQDARTGRDRRGRRRMEPYAGIY